MDRGALLVEPDHVEHLSRAEQCSSSDRGFRWSPRGDVRGREAPTEGLPDSLVFNDNKDFGPRVGFAYLVPGMRDTVVRGGYGIFYQRDTENKFVDMALNPPFVSIRTFSFDQTNFRDFDWFDPTAFTTISGVGLFANDPYAKNGRIQAYNLSVEHIVRSTLFA